MAPLSPIVSRTRPDAEAETARPAFSRPYFCPTGNTQLASVHVLAPVTGLAARGDLPISNQGHGYLRQTLHRGHPGRRSGVLRARHGGVGLPASAPVPVSAGGRTGERRV